MRAAVENAIAISARSFVTKHILRSHERVSTHNRSVEPGEKGSAPLHGHPFSLSAASCLFVPTYLGQPCTQLRCASFAARSQAARSAPVRPRQARMPFLCAWLHSFTQCLCSRCLAFAAVFAFSLAARARSRPPSERPFDLSEAVPRPLSARPADASEDLPIPRSTPVPAGGPPAERPPPRPRPWAEPITWSPTTSNNTKPNLAIIFNGLCITFPPPNGFCKSRVGNKIRGERNYCSKTCSVIEGSA